MLTSLEVSTADDLRDELRNAVRDHLADEVRFFELDYQPPPQFAQPRVRQVT